jgi:hypothetical protein
MFEIFLIHPLVETYYQFIFIQLNIKLSISLKKNFSYLNLEINQNILMLDNIFFIPYKTNLFISIIHNFPDSNLLL